MKMADRRGIVLILVFIILVVITIIVIGFLYMMSGQLRSTGVETAGMKAFWLADAGVEQAVYKIKTNTPAGYRSNPANIPSTSLGVDGGTYSVTVSKDATTKAITIISTGTVAGVSRQIRSIWYDTAFSGAAFAGASGGSGSYGITLKGTTNTDSYDSSLGLYNAVLSGGNRNIGYNGDIATNSDISLSGSGQIGGDASTGPSGTFNQQSAVVGAINHDTNMSLPAVVVPSLSWSTLPTIQNNKTNNISSGNYTATDISIGSQTIVNITGPANILLTSTGTSVSIGAQAVINVTAASTGPVIVYANGGVTMGGQGITNSTTNNNPTNFQLYGYNTNSVTYSFSAGSAFYGLVYAPQSDLTMTGNSGLYGAFIVNSITKNTGTSSIHYDQNAVRISPPTATGVMIKSDWREVIPPQ